MNSDSELLSYHTVNKKKKTGSDDQFWRKVCWHRKLLLMAGKFCGMLVSEESSINGQLYNSSCDTDAWKRMKRILLKKKLKNKKNKTIFPFYHFFYFSSQSTTFSSLNITGWKSEVPQCLCAVSKVYINLNFVFNAAAALTN